MASKMQTTMAESVPEFNATTPVTPQSKYSNKGFTSLPLAAAHFDSMPNNGYVRAPVVRALFGISNATMHRWILASRIPAPKKIGRTSLFQVGQLRACLEKLQLSAR
jgi:predicted DNA-binding transcriptional regulator AlpA